MTNDEIVAGLRIAIERGSSLEEATQSYINAGYNPAEVRVAAEFLTSGVLAIASPVRINLPKLEKKEIKEEKDTSQISPPQAPQPTQQFSALPVKPIEQKPRRSTGVIIIIIILFVLLIFIIGGILSAIFFGDQILETLFGK